MTLRLMTRKLSRLGKPSRDKGKRTERAAAAAWTKTTGNPARRSSQFCGQDGTADLIATDGVHIEVKARKSIAALRFYDQAKHDAKPGNVPIVLMKEDRGDFFLIVRLDQLQELVERIDEGRGEAPAVDAS